MDEPREHYRGTFLPVELIKLYESGTLNAEEVLLLAKIDALQDPKAGGCWASNQYLGKWWGKSDRWVSSTVAKFQQLKLVEVVQLGDGKRIIQMPGVSRNKTSTCRRNKTSIKVPYGKERTTGDGSAGRRGSVIDVIVGPEDTSRAYSTPVVLFAHFSQRRGFHKLPSGPKGEARYKKGGQKGGWSRFTLDHWQRIFHELSVMAGEDVVERVMVWYLRTYDSYEFVAKVQTFSKFVETFDKIQQAMARQLRDIRKQNGDEEIAEDEDQESQYGTLAAPMSPAEQKKFDEDMRKIQFPTGE